jgi:hypothetical protein
MKEAKHCLRPLQIAKPTGKQCPDLAVTLNPIAASSGTRPPVTHWQSGYARHSLSSS